MCEIFCKLCCVFKKKTFVTFFCKLCDTKMELHVNNRSLDNAFVKNIDYQILLLNDVLWLVDSYLRNDNTCIVIGWFLFEEWYGFQNLQWQFNQNNKIFRPTIPVCSTSLKWRWHGLYVAWFNKSPYQSCLTIVTNEHDNIHMCATSKRPKDYDSSCIYTVDCLHRTRHTNTYKYLIVVLVILECVSPGQTFTHGQCGQHHLKHI